MTFAAALAGRSWPRAWRGLGGGAAVQQALLAAWAEPQRHYHTLQHLGECIALFETAADGAERPQEVELALWFHDAVYEPAAADNEARSAAWAGRALRAGGAAPDAAERVAALVMATAHTSAAPASADAALLLDIDLAILGAPAPRFAQYEGQIRAEYAFVPDAVFRTRRRAVLESFAARPQLFHTDRFQRSHEAQARANLARALG
jgi:predicted metal-dependent HD superfamily phosphohydrolase